MIQKKANIFIVGSAKCGTTTLYHGLSQHDQIFCSTPKETNQFSVAALKDIGLSYQEAVIERDPDYARCFKNYQGEHYMGEASVSYLAYNGVAERVHAYNPQARILAIVRDPVDRAWSHYLMDKRLGYVVQDIVDIFNGGENSSVHFHQYFTVGLYYKYLMEYYKLFPANRILVLTNDDLKRNPDAMYRRVFHFLDLPVPDAFDVGVKRNTYKEIKAPLVSRLYENATIRALTRRFMPHRLKELIKDAVFTNPGKPELDSELAERLRKFYAHDQDRLNTLLAQQEGARG